MELLIVCFFGFTILFIMFIIYDKQLYKSKKSPEIFESNYDIKSDLNDLTNYVYIDTETSSLEVDRGEVLQLSAVKIKSMESNELVLSIFNEYIKPSKDIRIDALSMKVNGISLAKCKCPKVEAFQKFLNFIENKIICGYNVDFDINMIDDDMRKEGFNLFDHIKFTKDVLQEVRDEVLPIPNNKLSTVSKYLGFKCNGYHNAIFDCLATMFVDLQLRYNGEVSFNYEELINTLSKDVDGTFKYNDKKCKEMFNKKNVCVSGDFENINRKDLEDKIVECGGVIKTGMSKLVDIFIRGFNQKPTTKDKKYEELIKQGWNHITKYNEAELLKKIG